MSGKKLLLKALEQIRKKKGLTQKKFAENELFTTRQTYNSWINGRIDPKQESLEKIINYLQRESPILKAKDGFRSLTWSKDEIGTMKIDGQVVLIDMEAKVILPVGKNTVEAAEKLMKSK